MRVLVLRIAWGNRNSFLWVILSAFLRGKSPFYEAAVFL